LNDNQRLHSLEVHNYHIKRYGRCLYCAFGSKPVPKAMIVDGIKHDDGWVEYRIREEEISRNEE